MTTDASPDGIAFASRGLKSGGIRRLAVHAVMILLSLLSIFPIYWMIVTSLRPENEIFSTSLWPSNPSLENYVFVLTRIPMMGMLVNTTIVSAATALLQVVTGLFAAYALVRWRMRLSGVIHGLIALSWLVPFQVTMIPNYVLASRLGLLDTLTGLIVPNAAHAFAILLLYNAMRSFPTEILEAARIDGARSWKILWQIVVPNMGAPIASLSIIAFISAWNEYFWPLLLSRKPENSVVQIGLQMFMTQEGNLWGPLMAAAALASLPILIIYLVLQRHVIESFMKSGIR
ncbi:Sn-glycerol-3-phosphate transport membrane protein ABC transporter UgpE [Neorhizobium galegae bv. officinalis bv. officinalis str. HAMBI 1141]|uniref:sn-glycerol-3-phosphate transport system permease protein UgpE n=1 Tax=Neorhizobium galegae bv. officinalis bv. officinalis str. HAMBI 1141 TaxID=1028801 RepID=A0A068T7S4_NEOGA|nr:carbohydrate ABC transporter permease [Neorhizobium galegae]CDN54582.1 Sn-glycerol-3-phosphate transport membrane protein ABC transporter UgpE [Neorhizobium galegae bv. officinalis bv. officinalis str. HAMBI 1141]